MRKLLFILAVALAIGVLAPAGSVWASPGQDQLTGTGTLGQFGDPTAHVNAIQTAAGLRGGFTIAYPDGTFAVGSATCLFVSGNTAYVTSQITDSGGPRQQTNSWFAGGVILIGVQDHGEARHGGPAMHNVL